MKANIYQALNLWQKQPDNSFPHDQHPLDLPNGSMINLSQEEWDDWQWNPPLLAGLHVEEFREQAEHLLEADPDASAKPTWQELIDLLNAEI